MLTAKGILNNVFKKGRKKHRRNLFYAVINKRLDWTPQEREYRKRLIEKTDRETQFMCAVINNIAGNSPEIALTKGLEAREACIEKWQQA